MNKENVEFIAIIGWFTVVELIIAVIALGNNI